MYPYRTEEEQAAFERLPSTQYAVDDTPYLHTERYTLSPDYEAADVIAKRLVDMQGAQDNLHRFISNLQSRTTEAL